jgi:hypothetical protein
VVRRRGSSPPRANHIYTYMLSSFLGADNTQKSMYFINTLTLHAELAVSIHSVCPLAVWCTQGFQKGSQLCLSFSFASRRSVQCLCLTFPFSAGPGAEMALPRRIQLLLILGILAVGALQLCGGTVLSALQALR